MPLTLFLRPQAASCQSAAIQLHLVAREGDHPTQPASQRVEPGLQLLTLVGKARPHLLARRSDAALSSATRARTGAVRSSTIRSTAARARLGESISSPATSRTHSDRSIDVRGDRDRRRPNVAVGLP